MRDQTPNKSRHNYRIFVGKLLISWSEVWLVVFCQILRDYKWNAALFGLWWEQWQSIFTHRIFSHPLIRFIWLLIIISISKTLWLLLPYFYTSFSFWSAFISLHPFILFPISSIVFCVSWMIREPRLPDSCCYGDRFLKCFCSVLSSLPWISASFPLRASNTIFIVLTFMKRCTEHFSSTLLKLCCTDLGAAQDNKLMKRWVCNKQSWYSVLLWGEKHHTPC